MFMLYRELVDLKLMQLGSIVRVAFAREYPPALSAGMAHAVAQQLERFYRVRHVKIADNPAPPVKNWISEVAHASSCIRANATWLPDFQG